MTRIIAGSAGGRRLRTPPGDGTRPTSDRVRGALFSALESQLGTLSGRRFLDLFAGSGGVGLEARSRGAERVTLVEMNAVAAALIRANARDLGLTDVSVVASAASLVAGRPPDGGGYDVVFLDPPYATEPVELTTLLSTLAQFGWLTGEALVVVERPRRSAELTWPEGFEPLRSRRYGDTLLLFGTVTGLGPEAG